MDRNQKLEALFKSAEFKAAAENVTTAEELQALFAKNGVEMSLDDVYELCGQIATQVQAGDGELSEDALESVSGGIITMVACGVVCIGALAVGIWNGYHRTRKNGKSK